MRGINRGRNRMIGYIMMTIVKEGVLKKQYESTYEKKYVGSREWGKEVKDS